MELEVCTAESAQKVGRCLSNFLRGLDSSGTGTAPKKDESTGKGNALTKSGALGSSRERKNNDAGNNTRTAGKAGTKQQRSVHGAAFDRLRNPSTQRDRSQSERGRGSQKSHMNQSRGQNHNNTRRGHDNRGAGRRGRGGRGDGRGGRQHNNNMSGKRGRQREEEDFVSSALNSGLQSSRTDADGRGGRDNMQNKRARHAPSNEDNHSEQGAQKWSSTHWQEGRGGGRGFSRGGGRMSGRGRGRFSNTFYPNKQANEQEEAAAVSESPLVAGHFSGRHSFRGRGRGRGSFDGRGGRAGRAEVAQMISAKTWTRPRTMDEGLSTSR